MKKKILLSLMAVAMVSMSASAATKYEINVAGVEVTSDNYTNVTGGDISAGTVSYDPSSNTLTLNNVTINRYDDSGKYCVHNRDRNNLTIKFVGTCKLYSQKAPALKLQKHTRLYFYSGTSSVRSQTNNTVSVDNNARITFIGNGYVNFETTAGSADCFKGGGGSAVLDFCGANVTIKSYAGNAANTFDLQFYWNTEEYGQTFCNVRFYANGTKQSINNCTFHTGSGVELLDPYGAYYSSSGKTICTSSGSPVTSEDIYISNNFVAIFNETYFPDANFRGYLARTFGKGYINSNDVNNTKNLNASSEYIFSLEGLQYFSKLENFACEENQLTSLPSLPSTLKTLNCRDNKLTSLPYIPSGLTQLICDHNQLTSLPSFPNALQIQILECENNKLSGTVNLSNHPALKKLLINNNPNLKTLYANNCALTNLNVANCTALELIDCHNNQLTNLSVQGLNNLAILEIYGNQIKESAMGDLVNSLRTIPVGSIGEFRVLAGSGEGNVITTAQVKQARNKRWIAKKYVNYTWIEIPIAIAGDVNGDGYVTSADVTAIYDVLLGTNNKFESTADVNGDGYVTSADVTAVYDILLGN